MVNWTLLFRHVLSDAYPDMTDPQTFVNENTLEEELNLVLKVPFTIFRYILPRSNIEMRCRTLFLHHQTQLC